MRFHTFYGLTIASEHPIAGLAPAPADHGEADVTVELGGLPKPDADSGVRRWYESAFHDDSGKPALIVDSRLDTGSLQLEFADKTRFLVAADGSSVHASWPPEYTADDAAVYLLGPVMGLLLRLRMRVCVHASVVCVDDRAVAFAGPSGTGKSTLAATFARAGYEVLSDDVMALRSESESLLVDPGSTVVQLWPSSVEGLYGATESRPLIVHGWEKRQVDLAAEGSFRSNPAELAAVYLINEGRGRERGHEIESMSPRETLLGLVANLFVGHLPGPRERRTDFEVLSRVSTEATVRRLTVAGGWDSMAELPRAVEEDLRSTFAGLPGSSA